MGCAIGLLRTRIGAAPGPRSLSSQGHCASLTPRSNDGTGTFVPCRSGTLPPPPPLGGGMFWRPAGDPPQCPDAAVGGQKLIHLRLAGFFAHLISIDTRGANTDGLFAPQKVADQQPEEPDQDLRWCRERALRATLSAVRSPDRRDPFRWRRRRRNWLRTCCRGRGARSSGGRRRHQGSSTRFWLAE